MQVSLKDHAAKVLPYWPPGVEKIRVSSGNWMFDLDREHARDVNGYETALAFKRLGPCPKNFVGQSCNRASYLVAVSRMYVPVVAEPTAGVEWIDPKDLRPKLSFVDKMKAAGSFALSLFEKIT